MHLDERIIRIKSGQSGQSEFSYTVCRSVALWYPGIRK